MSQLSGSHQKWKGSQLGIHVNYTDFSSINYQKLAHSSLFYLLGLWTVDDQALCLSFRVDQSQLNIRWAAKEKILSFLWGQMQLWWQTKGGSEGAKQQKTAITSELLCWRCSAVAGQYLIEWTVSTAGLYCEKLNRKAKGKYDEKLGAVEVWSTWTLRSVFVGFTT